VDFSHRSIQALTARLNEFAFGVGPRQPTIITEKEV
jgi:hypothetical protein